MKAIEEEGAEERIADLSCAANVKLTFVIHQEEMVAL